MNERELVLRLKDGDREALGGLYEIYADRALKTAYLITKDRFLAEDVIQESFIKVFHSAKSLREPDSFKAYFYRIVVRGCFKAIKGERETPSELEKLGKTELSQEDEYFQSKKYELLYELIDGLKPKLKSVIILYYFNDMNIKEVSKALGIREGTVKSRLFAAKNKLKEGLNLYEEEF